MREIWSRADVTERGRIFPAASVGEMSVTEACQKLGISRQRFYELEDRAVGDFLESLQPKRAGRPVKAVDPGVGGKKEDEGRRLLDAEAKRMIVETGREIQAMGTDLDGIPRGDRPSSRDATEFRRPLLMRPNNRLSPMQAWRVAAKETLKKYGLVRYSRPSEVSSESTPYVTLVPHIGRWRVSPSQTSLSGSVIRRSLRPCYMPTWPPAGTVFAETAFSTSTA